MILVLLSVAFEGRRSFAQESLTDFEGEDMYINTRMKELGIPGADHVIDYAKEDFTKNGETYDVIIDVVGKGSFSRSVRSLKSNGRYILGNPSISGMLRARWTPMTFGKKAIVAAASYQDEDYTFLKELIEAGKIKSIIDRRYPLEQTAEAHRYVDTGQKKGNVVITLEHIHKPSSEEKS